jgi:hypothetical protein
MQALCKDRKGETAALCAAAITPIPRRIIRLAASIAATEAAMVRKLIIKTNIEH